MDRTDRAIEIANKIQKEIDKLKKMNFSISQRFECLCVFDNDIEPEKIGSAWSGFEEDFGNQVIYSFDLDHRKEHKTK